MLQCGLQTAGKLSSGSARAAGREGKYFPYNHIPLATALKSNCVTVKNEQGTVTSRALARASQLTPLQANGRMASSRDPKELHHPLPLTPAFCSSLWTRSCTSLLPAVPRPHKGSGLSDGRLPRSRSAPTERRGCPAGARQASAEQTLQQARAELTLTTETETQDHCHERREAKRQVQQVSELRGETGDVRHSKLKTLAMGTPRSSRFLQCCLGAMLCHPCCW